MDPLGIYTFAQPLFWKVRTFLEREQQQQKA